MGSQRVGHDWATNIFTFFSEDINSTFLIEEMLNLDEIIYAKYLALCLGYGSIQDLREKGNRRERKAEREIRESSKPITSRVFIFIFFVFWDNFNFKKIVCVSVCCSDVSDSMRPHGLEPAGLLSA